MNPQFVSETSTSGEFQRQEDAFREWISNDGSTPHPAVAGRYHLYVSLACPWASRTVIVRKLKGLEDAIDMTVVDPIRDDRGWAFRDGPGYRSDPINGFQFLSEAYRASDPDFDGRVTVPVLLDKEKKRIANNCEDDICRVRFDIVYHGHFKCNVRRIIDYPNLQGYFMDLYQQPGIADTVNFDHIKRHYYMTHDEINPTRIVPIGPVLDLTQAHGREKM